MSLVVYSRSLDRRSSRYYLYVESVAETTLSSSQPCHQLESCIRFLQACCRIYAFRRFERGWTTSTGTTFPFSVPADGWCRIPSWGNLPGTTRASLRLGWSNVAPCTTAFAEERATSTQNGFCGKCTSMLPSHLQGWSAARVVDEPLQCCLCSSNSDSLDHLPRCQTVLDVCDSARVAAISPPTAIGRLSLMFQHCCFLCCNLECPIDVQA